MGDIATRLAGIVGAEHVSEGEAANESYTHDESLTVTHRRPSAVVRPGTTREVAAVVRLAGELGVPVTPRGSGTGLSGAAVATESGILVSFERMDRILEIDLDNHIAVVQPGLTLRELNEALAPHHLVYPVFPGEDSASLGGNVATNAGGMRAVKYGVTRHHVTGLEVVLGTGDVLRTGGKVTKSSTGYDLTQLVIGSEGTLALVTEITLRLYPRPGHLATVLAPYATLEEVTEAIPRIVASGIGPLLVEYIDMISMAGITANAGIDLGIPDELRDRALAYLVIVLEDRRDDRLEEDVAELAELVADLGALDVFVLPPTAGAQLIDAREKAFFAARAAGADDIIDMVVPRASMARYMARVSELAAATGSLVTGCGHAGDGNVHLSVFQPDAGVRHDLIRDVFSSGLALGGAISGEHGIGTEKKGYLAELGDPVALDLLRRIKSAFDPRGILNPGVIFD